MRSYNPFVAYFLFCSQAATRIYMTDIVGVAKLFDRIVESLELVGGL